MEFSGYLSQYRKFFCFEKNVQHFRKRISRSVNQVSIEPRQIFNRLISESAKTAIFVKIDIEGAEYTVIDQIALFSQSINCIVIECHAIDRRLDFSRLIETFLKDFSIVHIHGNNFGPMNERENFPTTIELTLVNNALLAAFVEPACLSMKTYPVGDLDQANNPYIPDHALIFD